MSQATSDGRSLRANFIVTHSPSVTYGDSSLSEGAYGHAAYFRDMGFARCPRCLQRCNTKAKLAINGTQIRTHLLDKMAVQILGRLNYLGK